MLSPLPCLSPMTGVLYSFPSLESDPSCWPPARKQSHGPGTCSLNVPEAPTLGQASSRPSPFRADLLI